MNEQKYPRRPIVLIDDEVTWLDSFAFALEYQLGVNNLLKVNESEKAVKSLDEQGATLILLDINMPRINGPTLLKEIKEKYPNIPVLMLTGMNDINLAIECFKLGASDYVVKTDDKDKLFGSIQKILETEGLKQKKEDIDLLLQEQESRTWPEFDKVITKSSSMFALFRYLKAVSKTKEPVLITGESGTGKELFAEAAYNLNQ